MPSTFTIDSILDDNIGLMYFNPTTETLKEIDSSSTYITCRAFTYSIKRFYLCGTSLEYTNDITIRVSTSDPDLYTTKVISGGILVNKSHFDTATDELVLDTTTLGAQFTNAIPVDILIESKTLTEKVINLNIELLSSTNTGGGLSTCSIINTTGAFYTPEPHNDVTHTLAATINGTYVKVSFSMGGFSNIDDFFVELFQQLLISYLDINGLQHDRKYFTISTNLDTISILGVSPETSLFETNPSSLEVILERDILDPQDILEFIDFNNMTIKSCYYYLAGL